METNKMIAEFMGMKADENGMYRYTTSVHDYTTDDLSYFQYSWDWLMPVVETINTMDDFNYSVSINYHYTSITDNNTLYDIVDVNADGDTKKGCYKAVVKFIKWYNESKLNKDGQ